MNLNSYASSIKIEIEEVDQTVTTVLTDTRTVKFATNFSINPTLGLLEKVGLKFGSSIEDTQVHTVQKTFTEGNDHLGDVIVNFADDIIINKIPATPFPTVYVTREYNSGWFSISVESDRVQ